MFLSLLLLVLQFSLLNIFLRYNEYISIMFFNNMFTVLFRSQFSNKLYVIVYSSLAFNKSDNDKDDDNENHYYDCCYLFLLLLRILQISCSLSYYYYYYFSFLPQKLLLIKIFYPEYYFLKMFVYKTNIIKCLKCLNCLK